MLSPAAAPSQPPATRGSKGTAATVSKYRGTSGDGLEKAEAATARAQDLLGDSLDGALDAAATNVTVSAFYLDANLVSWSQ